MSRTNTIGKHCTSVLRNPLRVTYHNTLIVEGVKGGTRLHSGGWRTVTTKRRMNQAANQEGLGFHVYQEKGKWYLRVGSFEDKGGFDVLFFDGVIVPHTCQSRVAGLAGIGTGPAGV